MTADEAAQAVLTAHQRRDIESCLCGWSELGKSHPGHQAAMLREASLLVDDDPRLTYAQPPGPT